MPNPFLIEGKHVFENKKILFLCEMFYNSIAWFEIVNVIGAFNASNL